MELLWGIKEHSRGSTSGSFPMILKWGLIDTTKVTGIIGNSH